MSTSHPGGTGIIGQHTVARIGYGAMGLGHGLPHDDATAVLHRAVELGVNHIDTASFYDDGVVNQRIRAALAPYREDLVIVSKVGARRPRGRSRWRSPNIRPISARPSNWTWPVSDWTRFRS